MVASSGPRLLDSLLDLAGRPRWLDSLASREGRPDRPLVEPGRQRRPRDGSTAVWSAAPMPIPSTPCSAGRIAGSGWSSMRGRAAGRLGEYITSRDSLALDPARMTSEDQLRHALAHELAHRWQARAPAQISTLWQDVRGIPRSPPLRTRQSVGAPGGSRRVRGPLPPVDRGVPPRPTARHCWSSTSCWCRGPARWPATSPCSRSTRSTPSAACSPRASGADPRR